MPKVARFITLKGHGGYISLDEMEVRLRASQSDQNDLYSNKSGLRWAILRQSDSGSDAFQEITRLEAANHFIDRGEEPPEEILHFVSTDDIGDTSYGEKSGIWDGKPDETPQQLVRTGRGRWFLFFPDETGPRNRRRGVSKYQASCWLRHRHYELPADFDQEMLNEERAYCELPDSNPIQAPPDGSPALSPTDDRSRREIDKIDTLQEPETAGRPGEPILESLSDSGTPEFLEDSSLSGQLQEDRTSIQIVFGSDGSEPPQPRVILRGPNDGPIVDGKIKKRLSSERYETIKALIDAGRRLSMQELTERSGHSGARKMLRCMSNSDPEWKKVIVFPDAYGSGYGIL